MNDARGDVYPAPHGTPAAVMSNFKLRVKEFELVGAGAFLVVFLRTGAHLLLFLSSISEALFNMPGISR